MPAVVNVRIRSTEHIFGPYFGEKQGSGSGFVIKSTGKTALVVSNAHVVGRDSLRTRPEIVIITADGQELPGHVRGLDEKSDLCLIEVVVI